MAAEYTARIETFTSTVTVQHPRLGRVKMNAADYRPERDGPIIEGPTQPPIKPGASDPALKNPRVDGSGHVIADLASPLHRA